MTPFLIQFWQGNIKLTPDVDVWIDVNRLEINNVMMEGSFQGIAESLGFLTPEYLIRDYRMGITKIWFNQYEEGGEHDWHNHPGCQFTNCYYLELPDAEYATEVVGADGKLCKIQATEGDVMTCSSWMKHRSKPNGPGRKTIIAWNSNYEV